MKIFLLLLYICTIFSLSGCAINLPFNNRMAYSSVSEAKKLNTGKNKSLSIQWFPEDFPNRSDIQGASGFVGSGSQTRIPTGIALSNRIAEALDVSIGIDSSSKNVLEMRILTAESKFEYSAGVFNITPGMDYGLCNLEVEFNYNGMSWTDKFVSEEKESTVGGTSQTGPLEKAWDNVALQLAKSVVGKVEQAPITVNYKDSEEYRQRKISDNIKRKAEKDRTDAEAVALEKERLGNTMHKKKNIF
jgi:hypothetical protein